MSVSSPGTIISRQNVEQAVLAVLQQLLDTYLSAIETQNHLQPLPRPPSPGSFYGGVDEATWRDQDLPAIIVLANPAEDAIHYASAGWFQSFEVLVAAVVVAEDEDDARALADWYGAAAMALILQAEDLNSDFVVRTMMIESPRTSLIDEDQREFAQSIATYHTLVGSLVDETLGPPAVPGQPVPTVESTNLIFGSVPVDEPIDSSD